MDVRAYFQKIRKIEQELAGESVIVVSVATPDGGRAGRVMELSKARAAKMLADARVRLADAEEKLLYHADVAREQDEVQSRLTEPRTRFLIDLAEVRKRKEAIDGAL